jgi:hypothetical protein
MSSEHRAQAQARNCGGASGQPRRPHRKKALKFTPDKPMQTRYTLQQRAATPESRCWSFVTRQWHHPPRTAYPWRQRRTGPRHHRRRQSPRTSHRQHHHRTSRPRKTHPQRETQRPAHHAPCPCPGLDLGLGRGPFCRPQRMGPRKSRRRNPRRGPATAIHRRKMAPIVCEGV